MTKPFLQIRNLTDNLEKTLLKVGNPEFVYVAFKKELTAKHVSDILPESWRGRKANCFYANLHHKEFPDENNTGYWYSVQRYQAPENILNEIRKNLKIKFSI